MIFLCLDASSVSRKGLKETSVSDDTFTSNVLCSVWGSFVRFRV